MQLLVWQRCNTQHMRYYQQLSTITTQFRVQAMRQKELIEKEAKELIPQAEYILQKEKIWDKKTNPN